MMLLNIEENVCSKMLKAGCKTIHMLEQCKVEEKILGENIPVLSVVHSG